MAIAHSTESTMSRPSRIAMLGKYLPFLAWANSYQTSWLSGDVMAGLIVAIMLVPQGMAYAMLAGLPPQVGLYASILPLIIYGLLGSSRVLSVGPVAIVSLLVAAGVGELSANGQGTYIGLALTLALLVGLIQLLLGMLRIGFLVNFLSHPVLVGFTGAASLVIGASQLKHLLGIELPRSALGPTLLALAGELGTANPATVSLGISSIALLLLFKYALGRWLRAGGVPQRLAVPLTRSGPLVVVALGTLSVALLRLDVNFGVQTVGDVPSGLPSLALPLLDLGQVKLLLPTALAISLVSFMESISVAKSLACRRRQKVDSDQELVALGMANIGAALTGGYPVTGGFSRSAVNDEAGANTGLASMITAVLIALTVIFLMPLFYFLPNAVLAAIIIVAVAGLVDVAAFRQIWGYSIGDGLSMLITFLAVLIVGIESGILIGIAAALLLFIRRTSKPHVAVVGRLGDSEIYRNVLRHQVQTCPTAIALRVDENLYFANAKVLEDTVLQQLAEHPECSHLVLIGTAVNFIDASALESLELLHRELSDAGVAFHLAAIKGPVFDQLANIGFTERLGRDRIHLSTHDAMKAIGCAS